MNSMADRIRLLERRVAALERELRREEAPQEPAPVVPAPEPPESSGVGSPRSRRAPSRWTSAAG
jgi:hypothetical protein